MTDNKPSTADQIGQAAGGISGVVAGAAIGATAGPLGVLLGGIAGAIGGWWSGRAIAEAAEDITTADEEYYRADFERRDVDRRASDRGTHDRRSAYADARGAYYLGDVASANPEYAERTFEDVETDLERGWTKGGGSATGEWEAVRDFASVGFARGKDRRRLKIRRRP
jgi:hypothetical protein